MEADLEAKGYSVRKISGPDAKIYDNEYKIALRVGTKPYAYNVFTGELYYDYHFMRQTNPGSKVPIFIRGSADMNRLLPGQMQRSF